MKSSIPRALLAGVLGGLAFGGVVFATFGLIGIGPNRNGIILDPSVQSPKLIQVWTTLEPLPLVITNPAVIFVGFVLFAVALAFIHRSVAPAWPAKLWARTWRLTAIAYLPFVFFEFFTPFNLLGEPPQLLGVELSFWAISALAEAAVIATAFEWKGREAKPTAA